MSDAEVEQRHSEAAFQIVRGDSCDTGKRWELMKSVAQALANAEAAARADERSRVVAHAHLERRQATRQRRDLELLAKLREHPGLESLQSLAQHDSIFAEDIERRGACLLLLQLLRGGGHG